MAVADRLLQLRKLRSRKIGVDALMAKGWVHADNAVLSAGK
jgi:hypothetical protein